MKQYNVTGMSCAACSARVEKAVAGVAGVSEVSVSLLTNSMGVEGTASAKDIIAAVEAAGYGASVKRKEDMTGLASLYGSGMFIVNFPYQLDEQLSEIMPELSKILGDTASEWSVEKR